MRARFGWPFAWSIVAVSLFGVAVTYFSGVAVGAATVVVVSLLVGWWLAATVSEPIRELNHVVGRIAAGEFGHRIYASRGEFATLTRSVNEMSERLAERFDGLQSESQQLRMILSGMVEGVIAIDGDQRIIFANDRAVQLLELPRPVAGRPLWEIVRHREVRVLVERALAEAHPSQGELVFAGSAAEHVMAHVARLPGAPARGAVMVLHDMTELRRLERLRQDFVANVSHELKTPLAIIAACTETLQSGALDDLENRDAFLARIAEQAERLHALILDLLSLARIESNDVPMDMSAVPLLEVVEACVQRHRERATRQNVNMTVASAEVLAWADEEGVRQILDNLIDNALKYTPAGGRIDVRWQTDGADVRMEVQDTGVGIPEADVPRIFERFYRVDKNRSRELGGTGLGLAIVKHLAQAMHGSVAATSRVNHGTTITVRLRLAAPDDSSPSLHAQSPALR